MSAFVASMISQTVYYSQDFLQKHWELSMHLVGHHLNRWVARVEDQHVMSARDIQEEVPFGGLQYVARHMEKSEHMGNSHRLSSIGVELALVSAQV